MGIKTHDTDRNPRTWTLTRFRLSVNEFFTNVSLSLLLTSLWLGFSLINELTNNLTHACIHLFVHNSHSQKSFFCRCKLRYHNREAVVISALQVEKHPLTTPGPYTPPVQRSFHTTAMALSAFGTTPPSSTTFARKGVHIMHGDHLTIASSSNGSPIPMRPQSSSSYYTNATTVATTNLYGSPRFGEQYVRSSPKPQSSPKMKLRLRKTFWCLNFLIDVVDFVDKSDWTKVELSLMIFVMISFHVVLSFIV